jgi:hypothetical protein
LPLGTVALIVLLEFSYTTLLENRQVRDDFLKEHPNYTIVSIGDADGNNTSVVTFFIRYKKPNDVREYWSDRAYETKDGKYVLVGQGTENVFSDAQGK